MCVCVCVCVCVCACVCVCVSVCSSYTAPVGLTVRKWQPGKELHQLTSGCLMCSPLLVQTEHLSAPYGNLTGNAPVVLKGSQGWEDKKRTLIGGMGQMPQNFSLSFALFFSHILYLLKETYQALGTWKTRLQS